LVMQLKPKLVAFDLDGTLAESKTRMTLEMGDLLAKLLNKMPAAVLSGASFRQFETQLLPAMPDETHFEKLYLFPTNAAICYQYDKGTWRMAYDETFTFMEREKILHSLHDAMMETGFEQPPEKVWGERVE